jgi:Aspartyl protease
VALIDTGASITSIDQSVFASLGVNPVGTAQVGTAGGQQQQSTFPAKFSFPGTGLPTIESPAALGCNLSGQVVGGNRVIALIGRDLLANCVLVYNGAVGMFSLSF